MKTLLSTCLTAIEKAALQKDRSLAMPGNPRYQPDDLKPFFGYDQWVLWLATVEVMWLSFLSEIRYIDALPMTREGVENLFYELLTHEQDLLEKTTGHDINALIAMMKQSTHVPEDLKPFIHHGLTSYDAIETARALQMKIAWERAMWPYLLGLDATWRRKISACADTFQMGRTHLQDALPITAGFWLAVIHDRFQETAKEARRHAYSITGKITGAVGTSASLIGLGILSAYERASGQRGTRSLERKFLSSFMELPKPGLSTQIVMPERSMRFFSELVLLSGVLAQLGEDARTLQSSRYGELRSISSTSSTMAHKTSNPVGAESMAGMHSTVIGEYMKPLLNLTSDLQRDLRNSSPARDYIAIMVYVQKQIQTTTRVLDNMSIDAERCLENAEDSAPLVMSELLFLSLAKAGLVDPHKIVNEKIMPLAAALSIDLISSAESIAASDTELAKALSIIPDAIKECIQNPWSYTGDAVAIARTQAGKSL